MSSLKSYKHDLSTIEEISKLRLPDDEVLRVVHGEAVLEPQHRLFAERTVGHLKSARAVALVGHVVQRNVHLVLDLNKF